MSGGTDEFNNLVLIHEDIHKLIHAKRKETIERYLEILSLNAEQLRKTNRLRFAQGLPIIKEYNKKEHLLVLKNVENYLDI